MKKRKLKKKRIFTLIMIIILIGGSIYFMNNNSSEVEKTDYSSEAITAAEQNDIKTKLEENNYSKTLEEVLINNIFEEKYFDSYLEIEYKDNVDFLINLNKFLDIGYSPSEINLIFTLSNENISKLTKLDYTEFSDFVEINNYDVNKTDRYKDYLKENTISIEEAVTLVNIGLDYKGYENTFPIENQSDISVLVNKYNYLSEDYVPELVSIPGFSNLKLRKEASEALINLFDAAENDNLTFTPYSAYRSYDYQNTLYTNYSARDGVDAADTYSARPGHSEHQTGLAVDINSPEYSYSTVSPEGYDWLLENAHNFGFIVRYTESTIDITGYMEEPWHLRYLGIDLATDVINSGLTYDEYYDKYILEY